MPDVVARAVATQGPRGAIAADARTPVAARVPVLLVSGFFDPVTPPDFAQRVARTLPNSRLVVSPTGGHGSATGCPRAAVLHLPVTGTLDGVPAVCRQASGVEFLDESGREVRDTRNLRGPG